jgi:hypothetical protein
MLISGVTTQSGSKSDYAEIDKYPDHCPICHAGIEPIRQQPNHLQTKRRRLEIVFRCPREDCQSIFVARYYPFGYGADSFVHRGSFPFEPFNKGYSEHITTISPRFCAIANEAQKAESQGWKLICGPAYRKALEYLIKDYLCKLEPNNAEVIKKIQLGACIGDYVKNENVRATAARAVWLGNDETHYARKWEDKDLDDLKGLIELTVRWIEMEEMTQQIIQEMPEGKK